MGDVKELHEPSLPKEASPRKRKKKKKRKNDFTEWYERWEKHIKTH